MSVYIYVLSPSDPIINSEALLLCSTIKFTFIVSLFGLLSVSHAQSPFWGDFATAIYRRCCPVMMGPVPLGYGTDVTGYTITAKVIFD